MARWLVVLAVFVMLGAGSGPSSAADLPSSGPGSTSTGGAAEGEPPPPGCDEATNPAQCCDDPPPCCPPSGGGSGANPATDAPGSDPVSVVNGRQTLTRTDLVVPGVYPIQLTRRYDNQSTYDSPLGYGWSFSYDMKLFEYPDPAGSVVIRNGCGYRHRFEGQGGVLAPEAGRQETLEVIGDGTYVLHYPRGEEAHFDARGNLAELHDRHGNRLRFEHDPAGKHDLVGTSPFAVDPAMPLTVGRVYQLTRIYEQLADGTVTGREMTFAYDPNTGRLVSATSSDGRTVDYVHDTYLTSTRGNLVEVRLPVNATDEIIETYGYDDPVRSPHEDHNLVSIQLGQGETAWYQSYDAEDRVIEQTRGDCLAATCDRELSFDYSTPLTTVVTRTIKDDTGTPTGTATETFEYDTQSFLTKRVDALDNEFHYIRDGNGFLDEVRVYGPGLMLQKTIDLAYNLDGNLEERGVTLDSGEIVTESWEYDGHWVSAYQVVSDADPGKVFRTEYTFFGSGVDITNIKEIKRRKDDGVTFETTALTYDANGQLETITPPDVGDGLKVVRKYYAVPPASVGLLEEIALEVGGSPDPHLKRTFTYDSRGFLASVTNARGHTTDYVSDDLGRLTETKNAVSPNRESTFFRYRGPSAVGTFAAAPPGRFLSEVEIGFTTADGEGQLRRLRYDAEGRLDRIERKDDLDVWSTFTTNAYDSDDNRLRAVDAVTRTLTFGYDTLNRLTSVADDAPTPNTTTFAYDAVGNRTEILDAKSRKTVFRYDDLDRLLEVEQQAESLITAFAYDAAGNVTKVTDPKSQNTDYAYDALSRLTSVMQDLGQTVSYEHDGRNRLQRVINARGHVLDYGYLAWGGLEKVEHYDDAAQAAAGPPAPRTISYTYDLAGNLATTSDDEIQPGALYTFTYDPLDRIDLVTAQYFPAGGNRTLDSDYDRFGNRNGLTFTDGADVLGHTWAFDDLDRLESTTLAAGSPIQFGYYANDELHTITRPTGVVSTYQYWEHGPVKSITVRDSASQLLHDLQYTVDAILNVDTITETRGAGSPELFDYAYDGVDRLTQALNPTAYGLPAQEDYTYDLAGNRETPGVPSDYDYDANNRITASPGKIWAFDADGNVETGNAGQSDEERFTFDRTNRLRAWEKGPSGSPTDTASYLYDPFGRRIQKTANGATTWFLWDGDDLLAEFGGAVARSRRYAYAGGFAPIEAADPSGPGSETVYDVHADHLDSPRMMTDVSETVVWRQSPEAFGMAAVTGPASLAVRFPGQYRDDELALHYNRFRYYDPSIGRYVSADPIGQFGLLTEAGGPIDVPLPTAGPRFLRTNGVFDDVEVAGWDVNVYGYALANPVNFWDSSGLSTDTYHADNDAHGGPHIDRRNKAGQNVGRYRPDGSPIPHKGKTPPPIPKKDKKKFKKALDKLKLPGAVAPGVSSFDAFCIRNPDQCAAMFGDDLPPVDAGPPPQCGNQ